MFLVGSPGRDRVEPLPQNGRSRGQECCIPPGRIFESLSWEVDAGDPVDALTGPVGIGGEGVADYLWMLCVAMSSWIVAEGCLMMLSSRTSFALLECPSCSILPL